MSMPQPPMSRPPSAAPNGGKITDQVADTVIDPRGQAVRGYQVHFRTAKGRLGSVFVAEADYNPANVVAAARQMANMMDEVHEAAI